MRYKEFKEKIENWGKKYGYKTEVVFGDFYTNVKVGTYAAYYVAAHISNIFMFDLETRWYYSIKMKNHTKGELFDILIEFAKTPPAERKDGKRFIIPLPGLVTTDGEQQYLSENSSFFASRRDNGLRQTWKEEHLKYVPEIYRQFAVEFDEGEELEDDYKK